MEIRTALRTRRKNESGRSEKDDIWGQEDSVDPMMQIAQKLMPAAEEIIKSKGGLDLLALFTTDENPDSADLVVWGNWMSKSKADATTYVAETIAKYLTGPEMRKISSIVLLQANAVLASILGEKVEPGVERRPPFVFNGTVVRRSLFLILNPPPRRKRR